MKKIEIFKVVAAVFGLSLIISNTVAFADTPPAPAAPASTLEQRVAQRKAERGTVLSTQDTQRVVGSCVNAQGKLRLLENTNASMIDNRNKVYGRIAAKTWIAVGQLRLSVLAGTINQDTFQLEKQLTDYQGKTGVFQATAAQYKQALDDTIVINCKADPVGFKAMLETTRLYYGQMHAEADDLRVTVINTMKPSLQNFVNLLEQANK